MPPSILSGAVRASARAGDDSAVLRRHVNVSNARNATSPRAAVGPRRRVKRAAYPARIVPGCVHGKWRRGDASTARVIDSRTSVGTEGEGNEREDGRGDTNAVQKTPSASDIRRALSAAAVIRETTTHANNVAHAVHDETEEVTDEEDAEDDPWFNHLPYILEFSSPIDAVAILDSIDEDMQLALETERVGDAAERTSDSTLTDPTGDADAGKSSIPGTHIGTHAANDEFIGYGALFASIANLGLPALVNSCIEPVISSAETACAGKIGVLYLAALAPSSSLFAFAAEMCFAVSIVVTNTIAKTAAGESRAMSLAESEGDAITDGMEEEEATRNMRGTITAAVAASFVSGAVLALALALAAGPLLSLMHVPPEVAPVVRTYVAVRALGLPFFAASNAAEGVFIGQRDGVTPMVAWTATGVITLGVIVLAAHPSALGLGLPGSAAAISLGQALTALWFFRGLARNGWLAWPEGDAREGAAGGEDGAGDAGWSSPGAWRSELTRRASAFALAAKALWSRSVSVLVESRMLNEIGWMFLGAFSRMGTYAAITASASALGVLPGATHKVAMETFWILSFLTEPVFTACNALIPRELHAGRWGSARKLRGALVALSVALGVALSGAAFAMTRTAVYSDDPLVTAALMTLTTPLSVALGLSAIAYGVEGTIIGCGEVGYLGRTHARDFLLVLALLKAHQVFPAIAGSGLSGIWWVLAFFQGLRICQHWFHLAMTRPFWEVQEVEEEEEEVKALLIA